MRKEYHRNQKIALYGTAAVIAQAEAVLDTLDGLEGEIVGHRLLNEGEIRLILQAAIDTHIIKATILVDGNTVYPYEKIIKQYEQFRKSGTLKRMSNEFYEFLHGNFDIAYYDRNGYIAHYGNNFEEMKKVVLDKATAPGWYSDLQRILDYIQGRSVESAA